MHARHGILQGINKQPDDVRPANTIVAPISPADSAIAFDYQIIHALDDAEAEVKKFAAQANPYADKELVHRFKVIRIPNRKLGKAYEEIIHQHLTNPRYGTCYARPQAFLIGLEMGQDMLSQKKQEMHKQKDGLRKLLVIREGLIGRIQQVLDASGDRNEIYILGDGPATVRSQHMLEKNSEEYKEDKAIEASRENLKRRAEEMENDNEETVSVAKRLRTHLDNGGIILSEEPVDLEKKEAPFSAGIRKAVEDKRHDAKILLENELRAIEHYKIKIREADARYKDLCRAHMLIYLELKREGWENVPIQYRRPGFWFS